MVKSKTIDGNRQMKTLAVTDFKNSRSDIHRIWKSGFWQLKRNLYTFAKPLPEENYILKRIIFIFIDLILVGLAFVITALFRSSGVETYVNQYRQVLPVFLIIWLVTSFITGKYSFLNKDGLRHRFKIIIFSNFLSLSVSAILFFASFSYNYSRVLVMGTIAVATILEILAQIISRTVLTAGIINEAYIFNNKRENRSSKLHEKAESKKTSGFLASPEVLKKQRHDLERLIIEEAGSEVNEFIDKYLSATHYRTAVLSTTTRFNVLNLPSDHYEGIINLHRINDFQFVNKFMEAVNQRLPEGGIYIGNAFTLDLRKKKILRRWPAGINYLVYTIDFLLMRVMPKVVGFKKIYFAVTRGQNRVISRAETLGRLYSCGFMVIEEKEIDDLLYFAAEKIKEPDYNNNATYGPLIRLNRVGLGGKNIVVFKFRTMHPYSEYIQSYVFESNNLDKGGKFQDDFRVTTLGRILRKFWLDELPMLINLFRRELKLVGIRPLSSHYLSLYPKEFRERRIRYKPGLIPPFYADMPDTLDEIVESEKRYLDLYDKKGWVTDLKYFRKALFNILFKHARSK